MATSTSLMIGIYLILVGGAILIWWQFREMRKNFWNNRHIEIRDPVRPIDLTKGLPSNGPRTKPKFRSDEKLFEIEQNPAKQ